MTELDALRRFFLFVYGEAFASHQYHEAYRKGGQHVNHHPGYPPTIANRIVRDAAQLGLGVDWTKDGQDFVTFADSGGDSPALGGDRA